MWEFVIKYWIEIAFSCIVGVISFTFKKSYTKYKNKMDNVSARQQAVEQGVQALLRNELIRRYREYEAKGEISILDKENIEHMYNEYKNLGGNGTVAKMYDDLMNLDTKIIKG